MTHGRRNVDVPRITALSLEDLLERAERNANPPKRKSRHAGPQPIAVERIQGHYLLVSLAAHRQVPHNVSELRLPRFIFDVVGRVYTKHSTDKDGVYHGQTPPQRRAAKDKSAFIARMFALLATGAAPQEGTKRKHARYRVSLASQAARLGYKWPGSIGRRWDKSIPAFMTRRRVGQASDVWITLPEGERTGKRAKYGEADYLAPTSEQLSKHKDWQHYWLEDGRKTNGYSWIPGWVFDPRAPGSPYARQVLAYLMSIGLCRVNSRGRVTTGEVSPRIGTIAGALGFSDSCVRSQLRFWRDLGLLRLIEQPCRKNEATGEWEQAPSKIVWLPGRVFDAEQKLQAYMDLLKRTEKLRSHGLWGTLDELAKHLLDEWEGTERTLETFWSTLERQAALAGLPRLLVDCLGPPGPPG